MKKKTNKKLEEIKKCLKDTQESQEKTIKQLKKTVQDMKTEMEITKTQSKGQLYMENLGKTNRDYRCKYNQPNTRDRRKNLRC